MSAFQRGCTAEEIRFATARVWVVILYLKPCVKFRAVLRRQVDYKHEQNGKKGAKKPTVL